MERNEVFDYYQEVARSGFADMLHDTERNERYESAIIEAIKTQHSRGKLANVLDIGTGTGLLAMLAAKHGADTVTTVEAYSPISAIAMKTIRENGFGNRIKVVNKHSTNIEVGPGKDMEEKANILVAEVFDTELIGEGAIKTYNDAHARLVEKGCICVPHSATVYVQVVNCPVATAWNTFKPIHFAEKRLLDCPEKISNCTAVTSIHDIQLSQLPTDQFTILCEPIPVFLFDWAHEKEPSKENKDGLTVLAFPVVNDGTANAVFFWWDLKMNQSGSNTLSCAPHWSHPATDLLSHHSTDEQVRRNSIPWRDHWMQGCFYLKSNKELHKGSQAFIVAKYDQFAWYFNVSTKVMEGFLTDFSICNCSFHTANSRNRIIQMNSQERMLPYIQVFKKEKDKCLLFVGDHNLLAFVAASVQESKVYLLQGDPFCRISTVNFMNETNRVNVIEELNEISVEQISHLIAEPHFNESVLPWDNITKFLKQVNELREIQTAPFTIMPYKASIYAVPVHFLNLHKIRWPLRSTCGGFDHSLFDKVMELASSMADDNTEPFSLWEYPCIAVGAAKCILEVSFYDKAIDASKVTLNIEDFGKTCNGIAFWVKWNVDDSSSFPCGPTKEIKTGEFIEWRMEERQGVHLIPCSKIEKGTIEGIEIKTEIDKKHEKLAMDFTYRYQSL